jgi:hypothetical protein
MLEMICTGVKGRSFGDSTPDEQVKSSTRATDRAWIIGYSETIVPVDELLL